MKLLWTLILLVGTTTIARADWKVNTEYVRGSTQIRVLSRGAHTVRVQGKTETTPAVFTVPNHDGYYTVEVTTAGGQRWSQKLEVRRGYETKLRIDWASSAPRGAPAAGGRIHRIGTLRNDTQHCGGGGVEVRFDVMDGNRTLLSRALAPGAKAINLEVPSGSYPVRVYKKQSGQFIYAETATLQIDRDGWSLGHGCKQVQQFDGMIYYRCPTRTRYRVQIGKQSWDVNRHIPVRLPEGTHDYQIFMFDEGYWVPFKSGKVTAKPSWSISLC